MFVAIEYIVDEAVDDAALTDGLVAKEHDLELDERWHRALSYVYLAEVRCHPPKVATIIKSEYRTSRATCTAHAPLEAGPAAGLRLYRCRLWNHRHQRLLFRTTLTDQL
jgi:hypothetical protein